MVTDAQVEALRAEIREGFQSVNARLKTMEANQQEGFSDLQQALHGLMFKLLTAHEINEIRSKMKNAPDIKEFPFWAIR